MNEPLRKIGNDDDTEYHGFLHRLQARFVANTEVFRRPLFLVDAPDLWDVYLTAFPENERQFHNCSACRRFVREAGRLVVIEEDGSHRSALWHAEDAPGFYTVPVAMAAQTVAKAQVISPFKTRELILGYPHTGPWRHMALTLLPSAQCAHSSPVLSAKQRMAEMRADFGTVARALVEWSLPTLETAVSLLKADALYRSEKVLGAAEWLLKLRGNYGGVALTPRGNNVVWKAIATAPQGFCHPRSGVLGTLLDDIESGMPFNDFAARFKAKMHPLVYQRPQTPPSSGNIRASEKLVAQLGIASSLRRRYARLEDLETVWKTKPVGGEHLLPKGVFGGVQPKGKKPAPTVILPGKPITWRKFAETVLPTADSISLRVPDVGAFGAYVTAADPDAPNILAWDNPVSWYQFHGGSLPRQWNLTPATWVTVNAISPFPSLWGGGNAFFGRGVLFVLEDCRQAESPGLGLFPEILKGDLHSARKTIEAYSNQHKVEDPALATACGLLLGPSYPPLVVNVFTGVVAQYVIDRWE